MLEIPLDRDEGGYAYTAQLLLDGIPPFAQTYDMKMPGLYCVYALILAIFGQTTVGIHLGLLVFNAATIVLIFLMGRRVLDTVTGVVAAGAYAIISINQHVRGLATNAEHLLIVPALGGILLMLCAADSRRLKTLFISGFLLGVAFVIKHHGIFFVGFGCLYLLVSYFRKPANSWKRFLVEYGLFGVGIIIPFGLLCLWFWYVGLFDKFWFWLFEYTREYSTAIPLSTGLKLFSHRASKIAMIAAFAPFRILAVIGLIALICYNEARKRALFVGCFFLLSFLSIIPGYNFLPHYFILVLPAIALLGGIAVSWIAKVLANDKFVVIRKGVPILIAGGAILYSAYAQRMDLFELSPNEISMKHYWGNPFPESVEIAKYIKNHTSSKDYIAILGSEPQIYFYAQRRSVSSHIYVYPLMSEHPLAKQMQQEMIGEIEKSKPKFIVSVSMDTSWLRKPSSERMIFDWFNQYEQKYYKQVGVVEFISPTTSVYLWDQQAARYRPHKKQWIAVLQRKSQI